MRRRTFLQTAAAIPMAVLLPKRNADKQPQWKPPPRWEWEVGEWEDGLRIWRTQADLLPWEMPELIAGISAVNLREFCGIGKNRLQMLHFRTVQIAHHLLRTDVELTESRYRRDGWYVADTSYVRWFQVYERINFYDLFRGEHAVVSVGEKDKPCN